MFCANIGTFWTPFSTSYEHANFGNKPKLAETALLLYRVTNVPFWSRTNEPKLVSGIDLEENAALGMGIAMNCATFHAM